MLCDDAGATNTPSASTVCCSIPMSSVVSLLVSLVFQQETRSLSRTNSGGRGKCNPILYHHILYNNLTPSMEFRDTPWKSANAAREARR